MPKPMSAQQYIEQLKAYMAKIQTTDANVRPNQNPDRRIGTVSASFSAERFMGGLVPVTFDGEDTPRNIMTGVSVYANDRVGVSRYGNSWAITDNFTTAAPASAMKVNSTSRASTTTLAEDPELYVNLLPGKYHLEINAIFTSDTAADVKTIWTVPVDALGTRQVNGPGSGSTDAGDNSSSRWGGHAYDTPISYGARASNSYFHIREWAGINVPTGGKVALQWAQQASSATATVCRYGSTITALKIN